MVVSEKKCCLRWTAECIIHILPLHLHLCEPSLRLLEYHEGKVKELLGRGSFGEVYVTCSCL